MDNAELIKDVRELLSQIAIKVKAVDADEDTYLSFVKDTVKDLLDTNAEEYNNDFQESYYDSYCTND